MLELGVTGGAVMLDNIELWPAEENSNPTPFRDELVDALKRLNPGSMRYLAQCERHLRQFRPAAIENQSRGFIRQRIGRLWHA